MIRLFATIALFLSAGCGDTGQAPRERQCAVEIQIKNYVPGLRGHQFYTYSDPTYRVGTLVRGDGTMGAFEFSMIDTADGNVVIHWWFSPKCAVSADARVLYERRFTTSRSAIVDVDSGRVRAFITPVVNGR